MASQRKPDPLVPEMLRLVKIFGAASVLLVLAMAFFNERKANNSGDNDSPMHTGDAERLFFKNVRSISYEMQSLENAKMQAFRYGKREKDSNKPRLQVAILLNRIKDEAYLYWEPTPDTLPINFTWGNQLSGTSGSLTFAGGDIFAHLEFATKLFPLITDEHTQFTMDLAGESVPIFSDNPEREAVRIPLRDYFRMINKHP